MFLASSVNIRIRFQMGSNTQIIGKRATGVAIMPEPKVASESSALVWKMLGRAMYHASVMGFEGIPPIRERERPWVPWDRIVK